MREYKVYTDGRKKMVTIPAWSNIKAGDTVHILPVTDDILLVMRKNTSGDIVNIVLKAISTIADELNVSRQIMAKVLRRVADSYDALR